MNAGVIFAAVGFLILLAAVFIQAASFSGDFSGMPYFVVVGMVAFIIGFVLIGIFILRSGVLPQWVGFFKRDSRASYRWVDWDNRALIAPIAAYTMEESITAS